MDWICATLTLLSFELMARKKWYAWAISLTNNLLWFTLGYRLGQYGMMALSVVMCLMALRGLRRWLRESSYGQTRQTES